MEKIHIGFMKDLRIHEFCALYDLITGCIDADKIDDRYVKAAFEKVEGHTDELFYIKKPERNDHTPIMRELIKLRTEYLICLRKKTEASLFSPVSEERKAAKTFYKMLIASKKDLYKPTLVKQKVMVDWLTYDIEGWRGAQEALDYLGFQYIVDAIVEVSASIQVHKFARMKDKRKTSDRSDGLRALVYKDLKILIDTINFLLERHQYDEEESIYSKFAVDINIELMRLRREFKSRNTKRKNRKEKVKEKEKEVAVSASSGVEELHLPEGKEVQQELHSSHTIIEIPKVIQNPPPIQAQPAKEKNYVLEVIKDAERETAPVRLLYMEQQFDSSFPDDVDVPNLRLLLSRNV